MLNNLLLVCELALGSQLTVVIEAFLEHFVCVGGSGGHKNKHPGHSPQETQFGREGETNNSIITFRS